MKRIISLFLIISVFFSLNSCTKNESAEDTKNRVISEATAYLKENYPDDKFTYLEGRSPNSAYNYYELGFTSKNYDNQKVTVFGQTSEEKNDDGLTKFTYSDDYYQYYMLKDAEKYFYDAAKEYLGENISVKVGISFGIGFAKAIEKDKTFIENLTNDNVDVSVYIFYDKNIDNKEKKFKNFLNHLIDNKIYTRVTYLKTENSDEVSNKNIKDIMGHLSDYYTERKYYTTFDGTIDEY